MLRMFGLRFLIAASFLFVTAFDLVLVRPQPAIAQTSPAEIGETETARSKLASDSLKNEDDKLPQKENQSVAPQQAATSKDPANKFTTKLNAAVFDFKLLRRLLMLTGVVLLWIKAGDWVNQDVQINKISWYKWNPIIFFPFVLVTVPLFFMPLAAIIRAAIMMVVFLACWCPYVIAHNRNVQPHQTVLTKEWWRFAFAGFASKLGVNVSAERKADYEQGANVELMAMGAEDANADNANLLSARSSPGYLLVKDVVVEIVNRRCAKAMFDFTQQAVNARYEIDGVWHNGEATDRESGDVMLAVIKTLANLNVKDRRNKQQGKFGAKYQEKSFLCPIVTQGVSTGERVILTRTVDKQLFSNYDDLGMREGIEKRWAQIMASDQGLVVLSSLPAGGLTTITDVSLDDTDRLMRDFVAIEDVNHPENEIQNIGVHTYDSSAGESPATILPRVIRNYPNAYVCRDFVDAESAKLLLNEIRDERFVVTTIHAREAAEALLRLLQKKVPAKEFAATVNAVLYQRLVRLLCSDCKVGYTPPADVLRKLGIPAGKIEQLFRPPKPEEIEKPCKTCQNIGYLGRTGIFELLVIDDSMREILVKQPKLEFLKKAARASRQPSLQEEGILLVAKGQTSLPELMRVLK